MTPFASLQSLCGLSNREAAEFLRVAEATVDSWRSGRRNPPQGVLDELGELWARRKAAAEKFGPVEAGRMKFAPRS